MSDKPPPPPPPGPPMNFWQIGKLVKTWVLEEDRLKLPVQHNPEADMTWPKPVSTNDPADIARLRKQFADARTEFVLPDTVTEVVVVQDSPTRFVLKLPSAEAIRGQEKRLNTGDYPLPRFYVTAVTAKPTTLDAMIELDDARIGDYTISNCAG